MAILTAEEITAWLNSSSAIRGTLIEVDVRIQGDLVDSTRYLSTFSYTTGASDTPSNTCYESIVEGGLKYTEKMDIGGNASLSIGDVELKNINGEFDSWLNDTWMNRPIRAYVGDIRWPRDSFFLVFDGVVADIDSRGRDTINIKIRDKLQRLNTPLSELKYSDVAPYPDASNVTPYTDPTDPNDIVPELFLPSSFGEQHNITPILIDTGNLTYIANYGPIQGIGEVRDNGVPLIPASNSYTVDVNKGTFTMLYQPFGLITCSVQGDNVPQSWDTFVPGVTYRQTAGSLIRRIVTGYGKCVPDPITGVPTTTPSPERFTEDDIDIDNFEEFEATHPQPVGVYSASRENMLTICQQLAASVGAQISMSRVGKLRLTKLSSPPLGDPTIITEDDDMVINTLSIVRRTEVQGSVKLAFTKNWTIQQGLQTNIPYDHKKRFAEDYSTVIKADADTINKYKLTGYPAQQETLLNSQPEAYDEALRRLNIVKDPHYIYKFTGFPWLLDLRLGDTVQIVSDRFALSGELGVGLGTVISLQPDWNTCNVEVEVFI